MEPRQKLKHYLRLYFGVNPPCHPVGPSTIARDWWVEGKDRDGEAQGMVEDGLRPSIALRVLLRSRRVTVADQELLLYPFHILLELKQIKQLCS